MSEWKDISGHGDKTVWEIKNREFRICIHRWYGDKTRWYVTCHDMQVKTRELENKELEEAKKEAVRVIAGKINRLNVMIQEILKVSEKE